MKNRTHLNSILTPLGLLVAGVSGAVLPCSGEVAFDLTRNSQPVCAIITAAKPSPSARLAALELQSHVLKISGAEIPIRSEPDPVQGPRILVSRGIRPRD